MDSVGARWPASPVRAGGPRGGPLGRKSAKMLEIVGFGDFALESFFLKVWALFGNLDVCVFLPRPNFRTRFSTSARGAKIAYIIGVCAFLGLRYRKQSVFLGGPRRALFGPFFGLGWGVVRKNDALGNAVNIGVLEHLDAPHDAFL